MKIRIYWDGSTLWRDSGAKLSLNESDLFDLRDFFYLYEDRQKIINDGYIIMYVHRRHLESISKLVSWVPSNVRLILWTNDWAPIDVLTKIPDCTFLAPYIIKDKVISSRLNSRYITQPGYKFESEIDFDSCDVAFYGTLSWDTDAHRDRNKIVKKILENVDSKIFFKRENDHVPMNRNNFDFNLLVKSQSNAYRAAKFSICATSGKPGFSHIQSNRLFNVMASGGCPLVLRNEGIEDYVTDGVNGRIFETAEHALDIINETSRLDSDKMKKESLSCFLENHTIDVLYSKLLDILKNG
jgi:hypothetical protein